MGKELESDILADTYYAYFRTAPILEVLDKKKIAYKDFIHLSPVKRFDILAPEPAIVQTTIDLGNLCVFFPSMARLYRVWGRFPSSDEISYEVSSAGFAKNMAPQNALESLGYAESFFELFRPEIEEFAITRWFVERSFRRYFSRSFRKDFKRDDFVNEAHVAMREAIIFNFDWNDPKASPENYLMAYIKDWLMGYSLWHKEYLTHMVGFRDRLPRWLFQDALMEVEAGYERRETMQQARAIIVKAMINFPKDQQAMIAYILGIGKRDDVLACVKDDEELERLKRRSLRSLAVTPGVTRFDEDILDLQELEPGRPDPVLTRKLPVSLKKPPFTREGRSVFADLALPQVFYVISRLSVIDQFLVLSYLGYFPYEGQKKLAEALGYSSTSSLDRYKNIAYLTDQLESACVAVQEMEGFSREPRVVEILSKVQEAQRVGKLQMFKEKRVRAGRLKNTHQEALGKVDLSDPVNQEIYQRLTSHQRNIFNLITAKDADGDYVETISSLAQELSLGYGTVKTHVRTIARIFSEKKLVRSTQLRRRIERLRSHPHFLLYLKSLSQKQRAMLCLFLGISLPGETVERQSDFPIDIIDIVRLTQIKQATVRKRLTSGAEFIESKLQLMDIKAEETS